MALFPMSGVLRGFAPAAYEEAVCGIRSVRLDENPARHRERSGEAGGLVRPCSSEKFLIYELETYAVPNTCYVICGRALFSKKSWLERLAGASAGH